MKLAGMKIHFMGIGGVGVSALAELAGKAGAHVCGCDRTASETTAKLVSQGIPVAIGHDPEHVRHADLLVYTSAIPPDHPERLAAGTRQESRGGMLARFMGEARGWGVSGTHGKTTTSWLLSRILLEAGWDPTVFVGGIVPELPDGNYRLGTGPFVAELDESDASFLLPRLDVAIITNIESDHLSHYKSEAALFDAFDKYAAGVAENGLLVAGIDKPVASAVHGAHSGRKLSFGFDERADIRAVILDSGGDAGFRVVYRGRDLGSFTLRLPGRHNIENALAALGAAFEAGVEVEVARRALAVAGGVERRLERLGDVGGAALYTDYAHHPTEVAASLEALRQRHVGGLLVVFQPHLYSRTRDYADDFGRALALADAVLLVDIYPAREIPIPGVTSELLLPAARQGVAEVWGPVRLGAVASEVAAIAERFEGVVFMGAGDIDVVARSLSAASSRIPDPCGG